MKNKWILSMLMIALLPLAAAAQESYLAQPGNGSLFGGKKKDKPAVSQTTKQEKSYTSDYTTRTSNWGIGIKMGIGQNNPKTLKDGYDEAFEYGWTSKEITKNAGLFGLEALYEQTLNDEHNKLGVKVGWDLYGENELKLKDATDRVEFTETSYAFPITVYYKRDNGIKNFSWFAGAGITIMHSEMEIDDGYDTEDVSKTKVFPHVAVGGEYRFCKLFALGLDVRYNIAAKVKKDGGVLSDRSGFGAALTGRFYF